MKGLIEILFLLCVVIAFFYFGIYAKIWFWASLIIIIVLMQSEFVRHYTFQTVAVIFGALYLPMNMLLMYLIKKIEPFEKEDKIIYGIFRILFFPLQVIVTVFSIPYELLLDNAH